MRHAPPHTAIAIAECASMPYQRVVESTLRDAVRAMENVVENADEQHGSRRVGSVSVFGKGKECIGCG